MKEDNKKRKIAIRIKQVRKFLKLKQKELAGRLEISGPTLSELEAGKYYPSCEFLLNIHRLFNVNIEFLLFGQGKMFLEPGRRERSFGGIEDLAWRDDEIRRFLNYFENSSIMRHHMLIHFTTILLNEKELIKAEIADNKKSEEADPDEEGK